jgi:hypothetical protein
MPNKKDANDHTKNLTSLLEFLIEKRRAAVSENIEGYELGVAKQVKELNELIDAVGKAYAQEQKPSFEWYVSQS